MSWTITLGFDVDKDAEVAFRFADAGVDDDEVPASAPDSMDTSGRLKWRKERILARTAASSADPCALRR